MKKTEAIQLIELMTKRYELAVKKQLKPLFEKINKLEKKLEGEASHQIKPEKISTQFSDVLEGLDTKIKKHKTVKYTKNVALNDVLNETAIQPSLEDKESNYSSLLKNLPSGTQVADIIPNTDEEGNAANIQAEDLPEALIENLTKDYSALLNKSIEKSKNK